MKQQYTPDTAIAQLSRCGIKIQNGVICIGTGPNSPGLRAWGAIDYLRAHSDLRLERV